jgi:hypothetical protein
MRQLFREGVKHGVRARIYLDKGWRSRSGKRYAHESDDWSVGTEPGGSSAVVLVWDVARVDPSA